MNPKHRLFKAHIFTKLLAIFSFIFIISAVLFIFALVFYKAGSSLSLEFIFSKPKGFPIGTSGGVFPAVIGSLYFTFVATVFATALAFCVAIFLEFYCTNGKLKQLIKVVIGVIAGIPSIILGLFGYSFLVVYLGIGISILAGGLVLGLMIFPYIEVKFERIFSDINKRYALYSSALGVNNIFFIFNIVLPVAWRDLLSTISLASSLAMGATAPILLTGAVFYASTAKSILSPSMALPLHLYYLVGENISVQNAFATASVLLILLLIINISTYIFSYWRRER
ncbi:ABC transporter permease subunit [Clostridium sp. 'deep sea']|uniref:PstA family ABC transporter permease n=1 Tax=Clostridium sp. 'deep sea' TaxID=2779445 RepID=UPI00189646EA|nr:ABC transporter permease subunit [Clostridium sp. 'deep sea']QOR35135.1 ABC transporter permease subunit [Clostridium sp. 'deep sea']